MLGLWDGRHLAMPKRHVCRDLQVWMVWCHHPSSETASEQLFTIKVGLLHLVLDLW